MNAIFHNIYLRRFTVAALPPRFFGGVIKAARNALTILMCLSDEIARQLRGDTPPVHSGPAVEV